jgi:hypothetical protein
MLEKRDRGRGADVSARPMQYGATQVRCPLRSPASHMWLCYYCAVCWTRKCHVMDLA